MKPRRPPAPPDGAPSTPLELEEPKPSPQTKWNRANGHKLRAHDKVRKAIRLGLLQRRPCEDEEGCNNPNTDAHHDDYSKPLSVRWLCRKHHQKLHAKQRKRKRVAP